MQSTLVVAVRDVHDDYKKTSPVNLKFIVGIENMHRIAI